MAPQERTRRAAAVRDADEARNELSLALDDAGVLLPSLGLDTVSPASSRLPPLVDLGRCNPDTARKPAEALRERRAAGLSARVREADRRSGQRT